MEVGEKLTVNVDQVGIYRHKKYDEMKIRTGSSDRNNVRDHSSSFNEIQRRSNEAQHDRKKGSDPKYRKRGRTEETVAPSTSGYNIRPRGGREVESRSAMEMKIQQGGPVRSRKSRGWNDSPYIDKRTRPDSRNARQRGDRQQEDQERKGASTSRSNISRSPSRRRQLQVLDT
ncbi:uncharacterized protein TNCV_1925171, partial [Trichonephila clavipes]